LHPAFEKIFPILLRKLVGFRAQAFCRFQSSRALWIDKVFGMTSFVAHIDKVIFPQIVRSVHPIVYRQPQAVQLYPAAAIGYPAPVLEIKE
jgi:hypothetical protein